MAGTRPARLPGGSERAWPPAPASGKVINASRAELPELMGGSADLAPSTNTWMTNSAGVCQEIDGTDCHEGRNIHFGVREHGMGAIVNGMAYHGGVIPFGATFMVFSDYMRPPIRLSALSHLGSIWVFTHDSIGVGEDGPTHQPVEHLAALRAIPNLVTLRPADANEVREAWKISHREPPPPDRPGADPPEPAHPRPDGAMRPRKGLHKGAYVLADLGQGKPQIILMASGSEVALIVEAGNRLAKQGVAVRLVSFPSWELFCRAGRRLTAIRSCLPDVEARLAVEAGISQGWHRWVGPKGSILGLDRYGASGAGQPGL